MPKTSLKYISFEMLMNASRNLMISLPLLISIFIPANASDKTTALSVITFKLDSLLSSFPQMGPGGVALVIEKNQILFSGSWGLANLEWSIPNSADVKYRIGSLTKSFTALAILQLSDQGKLSLNDQVKKWLPDLNIDDRISIKHLLSHTSGIQQKSKDLEFLPGERMNYSNFGYLLLGQVISKASGLSYDQYIVQNIFKPLGMNNSGYEHNNDILARKASGYRLESGNIRPAPCIDMDGPGAAGGLYSTAGDLVTFANALSGNQILKKSLVETAFEPFILNNGKESTYGYGWMVRKYRGWNEVGHGGDIEGFNCYFAYFPDHDRTIIVLQNMKMQLGKDWSDAGLLAHHLADIAWNSEMQPAVSIVPTLQVPLEKLQLLSGTYEFENAPAEMIAAMGTRLVVSVEDNKLFVQDKNNRAPVNPLSETEFAVPNIDIKIRFLIDSDGKSTGLMLRLMGVRELYARKVM
jgi:CubicO group peptidase (beta-lactamase class C family)